MAYCCMQRVQSCDIHLLVLSIVALYHLHHHGSVYVMILQGLLGKSVNDQTDNLSS